GRARRAAARVAARHAAGRVATRLVLVLGGRQVERLSAGLGDVATRRADRARLLGRDLAQCLDELVDARVAGLVDLELVTPCLEGDRLVQVGERTHQREIVALDLLGQGLDVGL